MCSWIQVCPPFVPLHRFIRIGAGVLGGQDEKKKRVRARFLNGWKVTYLWPFPLL